MLYISTRNKSDSFTAHWALHNDRAPDGGMYVPFRLPCYDPQQLKLLTEHSFGDVVAQILNQFFSARLTGWDVEFCIGRYPVKLVAMSHRVVVAEIWHNPGASFDYAVNHLHSRILSAQAGTSKPTAWVRIAVYIAVLFGIYAELGRAGIPAADIALPSDDPYMSLAAWYCCKMGLPLGTVVLSCKDNDPVWELIQKGTLNPTAARCAFVEQLLFQTLGCEQALKCIDICERRGACQLTGEQLSLVNRGLFAVVAGEERIRSVISSVYRTNASCFSPSTALCFGCLQDYRSHTGESRSTLLLDCDSPMRHIDDISAATGLPVAELKKQMTLIKE